MDYTSWEQPIRFDRWSDSYGPSPERSNRYPWLVVAVVLGAMLLALGSAILFGTPDPDWNEAAQLARALASSP